ncbi:hypothetical protein ACFLWA_03145 [Chloroflexota bacterium]
MTVLPKAGINIQMQGREERKNGALLKPGDAAPDFELEAAQGQSISLSRTLRDDRNILLVFLRHLG